MRSKTYYVCRPICCGKKRKSTQTTIKDGRARYCKPGYGCKKQVNAGK